MKIVVVNAGSSTLKSELFETSHEMIENNSDYSIAGGLIERIGMVDAGVHFEHGDEKYHDIDEIPDHRARIRVALNFLRGEDIGPIDSRTRLTPWDNGSFTAVSPSVTQSP